METKNSRINREMGLVLKRERAGTDLTVEEAARKIGISLSTLNRLLSKDPRDINITQIAWLAGIMDTTPQQLVADAVRRAGGMGAIMEELRASLEPAVSGATDTTDDIAKKRRQKEAAEMGVDELEEQKRRAAVTDPELDTDEPIL